MSDATLHDLIVATDGRPSEEVRLNNLAGRVRTDSRLVAPGEIFWALNGATSDGHDFVGEAIRRGTACCIVHDDRPAFAGSPRIIVKDTLAALADFARAHRSARDAMVIGVTGSVGKTTTRTMLHAALSERFQGTQSLANFNNHVGVPLSLLEIRRDDEFAVMEMGASGVGEIARLCDIARPEAAVITSVAPAHLGDFGSLANIAQTKGELAEAVPEHGFVVLNGDNLHVRAFTARARCRAITIGESADNDIIARHVEASSDRVSIVVDGARFPIRAIGRHHVTSMLACIAVGREIGVSDAEIARGLQRFEPVAGRCHPRSVGPWTVIDDTYNASPASMAAACEALKSWSGHGRRWLVLGDMLALGPDAESFHRVLGTQIGRCGFDGVIALGEFAPALIAACKASGPAGACLAACRDLETVKLHLDCWLSAGDVVLMKGSRGMKMERAISELEQLAATAVVSRRQAA
jgi:UDP-N-acetylmuramoyl-tripeptide--D-alanyl-D-alanine ligase